MIEHELAPASLFLLAAKSDLGEAETLETLATAGEFAFEARRGARDFWIVVSRAGTEVAALRAGGSPDGFAHCFAADQGTFELSCSLGAIRIKLTFPGEGQPLLRCTTSLLPSRDMLVPYWPRDLYILDETPGTLHAVQRGPRSGVLFASTGSADPFSFFYFQNFSALSEFFEVTKQSPADRVGGTWPELGYAPPGSEDCVLPKARELVISDAFLSFSSDVPQTDGEVAAQYLDMLAEVYLRLPRPEPAYHDWLDRAEKTLRDLSFSPECTFTRAGRRYLMPYVGDTTKPPESMVQLTALVNTLEYDRWRKSESLFARDLCEGIASFFNAQLGTVVRWLPDEEFGDQSEEHMDHETMDSWYLYHALFNLARLASMENEMARDVFRRSLPYAIRVARRFDYRWPVFFNLQTLDIIRAEAEPGKGGENDVAGLYALVMLHAHELFGEREYLAEAERAAESLKGLGFKMGYQMNTTGFGAEAMMRLWKKTRKREYLELSEICLANMFDNMWLWQCGYARARHYATFFGILPLHGAPYLAAYEELEAQAKFHEYLPLGGEDVRPALRLLLAEYQKYSLDRGWFYYPDALPKDMLHEKPRNGHIERALAVPLEDLQDGHKPSGEVGQELYGAGVAFVYTSRHYIPLPGLSCSLFSNYPLYEFEAESARGVYRATGRLAGDPRVACELRIIPLDPNVALPNVTVEVRAGEVDVVLRATRTPEGHLRFTPRGGQAVTISWPDVSAAP